MTSKGGRTMARPLYSSKRRCWSWIYSVIVAIILCFYYTYSAEKQSLCGESTAFATISKSKHDHDHEHQPTEIIKDLQFTTCPTKVRSSSKYNVTLTNEAKRFQTSSVDTWRLTTSNVNSNIATLHFQILECPPQFMSSAFHVHSSTIDKSIFTGTVGPRYRIEEGCGYYNATIPIFLPSLQYSNENNANDTSRIVCEGSNNVSTINNNTHHHHQSTLFSSRNIIIVEAFWTSTYRNYANQMHDKMMQESILAVKDNATSEQIADMLGTDRLKYLARHLDILPGFPIALDTMPHSSADLTDNTSTNGQRNISSYSSLPNCSEVPIDDWLPVGVVSSSLPSKNGTAGVPSWNFQSSNCKYKEWTREELRYWLSGIRVRYLGDSHGEFENKHVMNIICPEAGDTNQFFADRYDCPQQPNNTFAYCYRFYRGILNSDYVDFDGLSSKVRNVRKEGCTQMLGLGFFNVTIITTPTWLFVYEIQESLEEYVQQLGDFIRMCRREFPSLMEHFTLLLQSPTAADVIPTDNFYSDVISRDNVNSGPASEWRQNHNFREEAFTKLLYRELRDEVDGIIPVFEWTLARNWIYQTKDGVHISGSYYEEIFHLQVSAIISAMRSKGWRVPLISQDDMQSRWFIGVPLE